MNIPGPSTSAPSFSDFHFKTIGKQRVEGPEPSLLKRMSVTNPESASNLPQTTAASPMVHSSSSGDDIGITDSSVSGSSSPDPMFSPDFAQFYSQFRSYHSRLSYTLSSHASTLPSTIAELSHSNQTALELARNARAMSTGCIGLLEQCLASCQAAAKATEDAETMCNTTQDKIKSVIDAQTKDGLFITLVKDNLQGLNDLIRSRERQEKKWLKELQVREQKRLEEEDRRKREELLAQMANYEAALDAIKSKLQGKALQVASAATQHFNGLSTRDQEKAQMDEVQPTQNRGTDSTVRLDKSRERQGGDDIAQKPEGQVHSQQVTQDSVAVKRKELEQRLDQARRAGLQAQANQRNSSPSTTSTSSAPPNQNAWVSRERPSPVSSDIPQAKTTTIKREPSATPMIPATLAIQPALDLGSDSSDSSQTCRGNLPLAHPSLWSGTTPQKLTSHSLLKEQTGIRGSHPLPPKPPVETAQLPVKATDHKLSLSKSPDVPSMPQQTSLVVLTAPTTPAPQPTKAVAPPRPNITNPNPNIQEQVVKPLTIVKSDVNPRPTQIPASREHTTVQGSQKTPTSSTTHQDGAKPQAWTESMWTRTSGRTPPQDGWDRWTSTSSSGRDNWGGASPMGPEDERKQEHETYETQRSRPTESLARRVVDHWSPDRDWPEPRRSPSPPDSYRKRSREEHDEGYPSQRRHMSPDEVSGYRARNRSPPPSDRGLLSRLDDRGYRNSWSPTTPPRYERSSPPLPIQSTRRTFMERLDMPPAYSAPIPTAPRGRRGGRGYAPTRGVPPPAHSKGPLASRITTTSLQDRMRFD